MASTMGDGAGHTSGDTGAGVEWLKYIWDINTAPPPREIPPSQVDTNIYKCANRDYTIPRRSNKRTRF